MEVYTYIEGILQYAAEHLLLDSLDEPYARRRISELLKLEPQKLSVDVEELDSMISPDMLLEPLVEYAVEQNIVGAGEKEVFAARVMDCVIKRPSEIGEIFVSLAGKNYGKALNWAYEYNVRSGYVRPPLKSWEGKATRGKIEVSFKRNDLLKSSESRRRREGAGVDISLRTVSMELKGENRFYVPARYGDFAGQGHLCGEEASISFAKAIELMADFAESTAGHFSACDGCCAARNCLTIGERPLPLHKAPDAALLKSTEYPYIRLTLIDWYLPALRLVCTTKEKIVEFAAKIAAQWGECAVGVRKRENDFVVEIVLGGDKTPAKENAGLTGGHLGLSALFGCFSLTEGVYNDLGKIEKLLTKELTLNTAGNMDAHREMIAKLIKEAGTAKLSPVEAGLDVKDIVNRTLENALRDIAACGGEELYGALGRIGIIKHI